ncbi:unnamed protein product [Linum trigynum]|uniref:non-specific serine/threonine protein kinase n=1 Tax=Linum trigynum TaxID=586398 RepID=A0AAV2G2Y2_9ROSI
MMPSKSERRARVSRSGRISNGSYSGSWSASSSSAEAATRNQMRRRVRRRRRLELWIGVSLGRSRGWDRTLPRQVRASPRYIAMELVRGGELFSKVARGRLREDAARVYFQQLIYHLDLNPENLLLLPFQDDNLVAMYRKIYRGDFKCPSWFSSESRCLVTKLLDPNPASRITISKVMESSWFRKPIPKTVHNKEEIKFDAFNCEEDEAKSENSKETLNVFHIISLSEGFDLSPLFEEKKRMEKEELRFATTRSASSLILRLEEVGKAGNSA